MTDKTAGFLECATCAAKAGSPTLCTSCQHNRREIDRLRELMKKTQDLVDGCPWCHEVIYEDPSEDLGKHAADCPAFTPDGEVK